MKTNFDLFKIYLLPLLLLIVASILGFIGAFNNDWLIVKISIVFTGS